MSTREEQVAAAERIAALNPEWDAGEDGMSLTLRARTGVSVLLYWPHVDLWSFCGPFGKEGEADSPTAAIRALGYTVRDE